MNIDKIKDQLKKDEGVRFDVYKDIFGYTTVGVGHLILPSDNLEVGDVITEEKCEDFLSHDINHAIDDCKKHIIDFESFPEEIQNNLVNLMFNMGWPTFSKFHKFFIALKEKDYINAAKELENSLWFKQTGLRAKRIVNIFRSVLK